MIVEFEDFSKFFSTFMEPFEHPADEESCIPNLGLFFDLLFLVFYLEIFLIIFHDARI